jgi:hypothetical protein
MSNCHDSYKAIVGDDLNLDAGIVRQDFAQLRPHERTHSVFVGGDEHLPEGRSRPPVGLISRGAWEPTEFRSRSPVAVWVTLRIVCEMSHTPSRSSINRIVWPTVEVETPILAAARIKITFLPNVSYQP